VAWPPWSLLAFFPLGFWCGENANILGLAKTGDFTSKSSTFVTRNDQVMGSDLYYDPPQAKREWKDGWEGFGRRVPNAALWLLWDKVVGDEGVCACGEHATGVVPREWISLDV
jgi:hypothetical protein